MTQQPVVLFDQLEFESINARAQRRQRIDIGNYGTGHGNVKTDTGLVIGKYFDTINTGKQMYVFVAEKINA